MLAGIRRTAARGSRPWRNERGQALVEIALALPLLLLLLIGIFEFARAYSIKQTVVNAAREGARVFVVGNTQDSARSAIVTYLSANNISTDSARTTISIRPAVPGDPATVTVTTRYDFLLLGPVVGLVGGGSFSDGVNLSSQTTMRME